MANTIYRFELALAGPLPRTTIDDLVRAIGDALAPLDIHHYGGYRGIAADDTPLIVGSVAVYPVDDDYDAGLAKESRALLDWVGARGLAPTELRWYDEEYAEVAYEWGPEDEDDDA